jgi:polyphosphate kinase 2 (PPK2 family)
MAQPIKITSRIRLRDFDPEYCAGLAKDETRDKTRKLCGRVGELQHLLYANATHSVIILLQGMDGSGKDSTGAGVLESVTPAGVHTTNFKAPSAEELAHDFLWRVHKAVPRYGCIGLFNRSHYEDVLIVRVLGLQPEKIWRDRC